MPRGLFEVNRHGAAILHYEISIECQNEEKQRFYGYLKILKLPNQFKCTYHLHICFDSLNGAELKV